MYKDFSYRVKSGTEALVEALKLLKSKVVIIPTYTCEDVLTAVKKAGCEYIIVDCGLDLQIDLKEVIQYAANADTVIVPHMFGIRADVKGIKESTDLKIIEDLSQCHGLPELGRYSHVAVSSTNKSKWIDTKGGGYIFTDTKLPLQPDSFSKFSGMIKDHYQKRKERAEELINAGVELIGEESSYLRGMYFTDTPKRLPYTPLHIIEGRVGCPQVSSYFKRLDWVSIFV